MKFNVIRDLQFRHNGRKVVQIVHRAETREAAEAWITKYMKNRTRDTRPLEVREAKGLEA
jgi:hypothetical protein